MYLKIFTASRYDLFMPSCQRILFAPQVTIDTPATDLDIYRMFTVSFDHIRNLESIQLEIYDVNDTTVLESYTVPHFLTSGYKNFMSQYMYFGYLVLARLPLEVAM